MNIVLGFGMTETAFEAAELASFDEAVAQMYRESGEQYFTDKLILKAGRWLENRAREYCDKSEEFKASPTFPDRYSYYYPHVLGDASHIVAVITFHHINRRHAFSPDGWALLSNKRCHCVHETDLDSLKEAA